MTAEDNLLSFILSLLFSKTPMPGVLRILKSPGKASSLVVGDSNAYLLG